MKTRGKSLPRPGTLGIPRISKDRHPGPDQKVVLYFSKIDRNWPAKIFGFGEGLRKKQNQ